MVVKNADPSLTRDYRVFVLTSLAVLGSLLCKMFKIKMSRSIVVNYSSSLGQFTEIAPKLPLVMIVIKGSVIQGH